MKKLIIAIAAVVSLGGCVAVPVYEAGPAHGYYYGPPAATFSFGYQERWHDHRGHGRGHDHRHRHRNWR